MLSQSAERAIAKDGDMVRTNAERGPDLLRLKAGEVAEVEHLLVARGKRLHRVEHLVALEREFGMPSRIMVF